MVPALALKMVLKLHSDVSRIPKSVIDWYALSCKTCGGGQCLFDKSMSKIAESSHAVVNPCKNPLK